MKKIKLEVVGFIENPTAKGVYTMIFQASESARMLPLVVEEYEARTLSYFLFPPAIKQISFYDTFDTIMQKMETEFLEVTFASYQNGKYLAFLKGKKSDGSIFTTQIRSVDAVIVALKYNCPIYTTEQVLEKIHRIVDKQLQVVSSNKNNISTYSLSQLEAFLETCIVKEDYEMACTIRDRIKEKKKLIRKRA